jgi:hypothetical protein
LARRIAGALVIALLTVGFVVLRDAGRSDAKFTVVSGPPDPVIPTVMHKVPTRYTVVSTSIRGPGRLYLQVGTYLERPKDTVVLDVLDARGSQITRCAFPPGSYADNDQLPCPLRDIARARGLIVTRRGTAKIALYAHEQYAGFLVKNEATSLGGRVSTVLSRVAVPLPHGLGAGALLVALFGSVALTAFALLSAARGTGQQGRDETGPTATRDAGAGEED